MNAQTISAFGLIITLLALLWKLAERLAKLDSDVRHSLQMFDAELKHRQEIEKIILKKLDLL